MISIAEQCLDELIARYPKLTEQKEHIFQTYALIQESYLTGGKLLTCGNGGSAADALHIVGELMKEFTIKRPIDADTAKKLKDAYAEEAEAYINSLQRALPAYALVDNAALSTAFANDVDDEFGFAQQVYGYAKKGDVLLGMSTSGNAKNIVRAVKLARCMGVKTVCLTGRDGGELAKICDAAIVVPEMETYKIQELHLPIYHALCRMLELAFFDRYQALPD